MLPFDVLVHVFNSLDPSRLCDDATRALASCLQVNRSFHAISQDPAIWKPHYDCRYKLYDDSSEITRRETIGNNWRARYAERRRIDKTVMALLRDMVMDRKHRYDHAKAIAKIAEDAWDALDIARRLPIPPSFRLDGLEPDGFVHAHALTYRYWADLLADAILKGSALDTWIAVLDDDTLASSKIIPEPQSGANFDLAMSAFSCFFGKPILETTSRLDYLAVQCGVSLASKDLSLDPSNPTYDLAQICRGVCQFMREQGFGIAASRDYRNMLNHFPHSYLTTTKKSIPLSLAHVFVAICRRFGVSATPVNFPGTVLVHVSSQNHCFIVNPALDPARSTMDIMDLQALATNLSVAPDAVQQHLVPCRATTMLIRQSNNIIYAFQANGSLDIEPCLLAAVSIHFLSEAQLPFLTMLTNGLVEPTPLDCSTFILPKLGEYMPPPHREILENLCNPILSKEAEVASVQCIRRPNANVRYFVGMTFQHARCSYTGCIVGWDLTCKASEQWIREMEVDSLSSGKSQPFYRTFTDDGATTYVAEENIVPINPTLQLVQNLYRKMPELSAYFEDVELHGNNGVLSRGRFLLSPESQFGFPQDDEVGAKWVKDGELPY